MANAKTKLVRVPVEIAERLEAMRDALVQAHIEGRTIVELDERFGRVDHLPAWRVIEKGLDALDDHKARSKKAAEKKKAVRREQRAANAV